MALNHGEDRQGNPIGRQTRERKRENTSLTLCFCSNIEHSYAQERFQKGSDAPEVDCILL